MNWSLQLPVVECLPLRFQMIRNTFSITIFILVDTSRYSSYWNNRSDCPKHSEFDLYANNVNVMYWNVNITGFDQIYPQMALHSRYKCIRCDWHNGYFPHTFHPFDQIFEVNSKNCIEFTHFNVFMMNLEWISSLSTHARKNKFQMAQNMPPTSFWCCPRWHKQTSNHLTVHCRCQCWSNAAKRAATQKT